MQKYIKVPALLVALLILPQIAQANFSDVPIGSEYYEAVSYIQETGGISDNNENMFFPDENIEKAAFYKMLLADSGFNPEEESPLENYFEDINGDEWYAPYANKAVELGLIDEDVTNFDPGKTISRAEAAKIILKWGGIAVPLYISEEDWTLDYNDTRSDHLYAPYIQKVLEEDLMEPYNDDFFGTYRKLTRGDAALLIYNFDKYTETTEYTLYITTESSTSDIPLINVLTDVYTRLIEDFYQGEFDADALLYTAISEMVNSIDDSYTVFSQAEATDSFSEALSGEYEGVGIYITQEEDGSILITNFLADSPAEEAGLKANDIIIQVDGEEVAGLDLDDVATLIKGEEGTTVDLLVQRTSSGSLELLEFTVERQALAITYLSAEILNDNIAYYDISFFGEQTDEEFTAKTGEFLETGFDGIILDLRNNPGGYVSTAANILSHFIIEDETLVTISYNDSNTIYTSDGPTELGSYPVVIVTDEITASASEIVAGALKDYGLAMTVGKTSFGKGSVQEIIYYDDGSSLKITVAHWLTPNGTDIDGIGIAPDIEVNQDIQEVDAGRDPQLEAAINALTEVID